MREASLSFASLKSTQMKENSMKLQMTLLSFASFNTQHSFSTIVKPVSVLRLIKVSSKHKFSLDLHTSRASTFIYTFHLHTSNESVSSWWFKILYRIFLPRILCLTCHHSCYSTLTSVSRYCLARGGTVMNYAKTFANSITMHIFLIKKNE